MGCKKWFFFYQQLDQNRVMRSLIILDIFFCFISEDGGLTKRGILIYFLIRFFCGTVRYARKQKYFKAEPTGVYYSIFSSNAGVVQKKEITQGRWE